MLSNPIIDAMSAILADASDRFYGTEVIYRTAEFIHRLLEETPMLSGSIFDTRGKMPTSANDYYVYELLDSRCDDLSELGPAAFYVGKGRGLRAFSGLAETARGDASKKAKRIREISSAGHSLLIRIVFESNDEFETLAAERRQYDLYPPGQLINAKRPDGSPKESTRTQARSLYGSSATASVASTILLSPIEPSLRQSDIVRSTGLSLRAVQVAIDALLKRSVIHRDRVGSNLVYIRPNTESFRHAIALHLAVLDLDIVNYLARFDSRIQAVIVFGSVVRGTPKPKSDLDILVVGYVAERDLFRALKPIEKRIGRPLDIVQLSPAEFEDRLRSKDPYLSTALDEGMLVMGKVSDLINRAEKKRLKEAFGDY